MLLAGALGNALNAALQAADHTAVGASTAIFGALGDRVGLAPTALVMLLLLGGEREVDR